MRLWIVGSCLLGACGSAPVESTTGDAGTSTGGSSSTGDGVDPSAAGGSTTSGSSSGTDGSSSGSSTTGDRELSICDPQPSGPSLPMLVDGMGVYETGHLDLVDTCLVDDARMEEAFLVLDFVCSQGRLSVSVSAPTLPELGPGDTVELSLFVDSPWWGNAYVKVVRDGVLVLAAMAGESLPDGGEFYPPEDFFAPLTHELLTDACEPEPERDGSSFLGDESCTRDRRLAITFGFDGDSTTVFDHNPGSLGDLSVHVGRTVRHEDIICTDTPGGWREFIVVRPSRVAKR